MMKSMKTRIEDDDDTTNNDDIEFWIMTILQIVLSPILMIPYLMVEANTKYTKQIHLFQTDPLLVCTELETIQQLWYNISSGGNGMSLILFFIGLIAHYMMCDILTIVLELIALYSIV